MHNRCVCVCVYGWSSGFCPRTRPTCALSHTTDATTAITTMTREGPGTLPSELGMVNRITTLQGESNIWVTGTVPSELGQLTNLEKLYLASNALTGTIPRLPPPDPPPPALGRLSGVMHAYPLYALVCGWKVCVVLRSGCQCVV